MDKKSVAQMHSVVLKGDAVSNIMRTLDTTTKGFISKIAWSIGFEYMPNSEK